MRHSRAARLRPKYTDLFQTLWTLTGMRLAFRLLYMTMLLFPLSMIPRTPLSPGHARQAMEPRAEPDTLSHCSKHTPKQCSHAMDATECQEGHGS